MKHENIILEPLSEREEEVASLIAWGASQKEVADILHISIHTVDVHVRHIKEKWRINKINEISKNWFCLHFNISFDLSPLKRQLVAIALLFLFAFGEMYENNEFCERSTRRSSRRIEIRYKRND